MCRSLLPQEPSGDAFAVIEDADCLTVAIVDGVGHGPLAHHAAEAAIDSIRRSLLGKPGAALAEVLEECHQALRATQGAAVGICRLDPNQRSTTYLGVGNTSFLRHPNRNGIGVSLPGIVGYRMRTLRAFDTDLVAGDVYALHTDGVSRLFTPSDYAPMPLSIAVKSALRDHGKITDDAAIVMVRFCAT